MSEKIINEKTSHHERDEAELNRLETNMENRESETAEPKPSESKPKKMFAWVLTAVIVALIAIVGFAWIASKKSAANVTVETSEKKEEDGHSENETGIRME